MRKALSNQGRKNKMLKTITDFKLPKEFKIEPNLRLWPKQSTFMKKDCILVCERRKQEQKFPALAEKFIDKRVRAEQDMEVKEPRFL